MVLPMKKVSLLVMEKEKDESLRKLRKLGVIHIEKKTVSSADLSKLLERKARMENALGILRSCKPAAKSGKPKKQAGNTGPQRRATDPNKSAEPVTDPDVLVNLVLKLSDEKKGTQDRLVNLGRERNRIEEWGNFDPQGISFIAENSGLYLFPYKLNHKNFDSLSADIKYILIGKDKNSVRLVTADQEIPGEVPFALPDISLKETDEQINAAQKEMADIEKQLAALSENSRIAEKEINSLLADIEYETAKAGMNVLEDVPAESAVSWITGFIPQEDLGILKRGAAENGWALAADDPGPDDMVPTKLKNNRLVSLLNPLTDFLEVVPGYYEADISGWFLLFFTIFFGMIFGDAAYGFIILAAAVIGIFKTRKNGVPPVLKLLFLLGTSNFVWGILTCTWFGIDPGLVPGFLQRLSLPAISNITAAASLENEGLVRQNLMIFCFSLALLQLSIGHIIAIIRCKTLKILGELGSVSMLIGMYGVVLSLIASNEYRQIPLLMPFVYLLGGGFLVNFIFINYDGSIGKSILESLKNIISMILGIANVFSDIMSYIRLWAVGLAGAAISSTVNAMAGPLFGHLILFVLGIVLVVFGHSLNLVLNTLSVLVHGVRLNTLEFSGHAGLTWSGVAYRPFKETGSGS